MLVFSLTFLASNYNVYFYSVSIVKPNQKEVSILTTCMHQTVFEIPCLPRAL